MVIPIIILVAIPIFLGIVYVSPFDPPEEFNDEVISEELEFNDKMVSEEPEFDDKMVSEEPDTNILYFLLLGIWAIILLRMLLQIKKGTFKATKKY